MDKFLNKFNENFWYAVIAILTALLLTIIGTLSDVDAAELPDETEPPIIKQPKRKTKKQVKKPDIKPKVYIINPIYNKSEETQYELVEDYQELSA